MKNINTYTHAFRSSVILKKIRKEGISLSIHTCRPFYKRIKFYSSSLTLEFSKKKGFLLNSHLWSLGNDDSRQLQAYFCFYSLVFVLSSLTNSFVFVSGPNSERMQLVSSLVRESIPNYLSNLPIPSTIAGMYAQLVLVCM